MAVSTEEIHFEAGQLERCLYVNSERHSSSRYHQDEGKKSFKCNLELGCSNGGCNSYRTTRFIRNTRGPFKERKAEDVLFLKYIAQDLDGWEVRGFLLDFVSK